MKFRTYSSFAAILVAFSAPALAGQWDAEKGACAEAVAAKAGVESANYDVKLSKARSGATTRVTVELKGGDAGTIIGDCKLRGGEVIAVDLKA